MSQAGTWNVPTAGPGTMSSFAGRLNPSLDALLTLHSGGSRPAYAVAHTPWLKIASSSAWELYLYDGSDDILVGTFNPITNAFTGNSSILGFATSLVARTDTTPLQLVNGRVVPSVGANGEGVIRLRGRTTSPYDEAGLVWANGNTDAAQASLLYDSTNSALQMLNASSAEVLRLGTDGDIVSTDWGTLSEQIVPPGTIIFVPFTSAPPGFLKENGAELVRANYPRLWDFAQTYGRLVTEAAWAAGAFGAFSTGDTSTTFRIPAANGVFLRGVYDEVDYTIGTFVIDGLKTHGHGVTDPQHAHSATTTGQVGATFFSGGGGAGVTTLNTGTVTVNANSTGITVNNYSGSAENLPRAQALLACIKY